VSADHTLLATWLHEVKAMESSLRAFQNYKSDQYDKLTAQRNTSNSNSHSTSDTMCSPICQEKPGSYQVLDTPPHIPMESMAVFLVVYMDSIDTF
jgi:hypothetical protein